MPKRVLYIQHAVNLGGSCMSLLYTLQGLDPQRYTPVVALSHPQPQVLALYRNAGFAALEHPGLTHFPHSQGQHVRWTAPLTWGPLADLRRLRRMQASVQRLLERTQPDLVHLNSAVMLPTAHALYRLRVPFVWHVREAPNPGVVGARHALWRHALLNWPAGLFFLSAHERQGWVGGQRGRIVHNFVDLKSFDAAPSRAQARAALGLPQEAAVLLYLGGLVPLKGIDVLLDALPQVRANNLRCLMPGSVYPAPQKLWLRAARALLPHLRAGTTVQRLEARLATPALRDVCVRSPLIADVRVHLAACDAVVFPAVREHFARPVVEAAAMGRPAVASNFPILRELIDPGVTGLLVPAGDAAALARALTELLQHPERAAAMGAGGRGRADRCFNQRTQVDAIMQEYDRIFLGA